ncbi:5-formyltetrahydrofolate cyclo-ligase [Lysobacter sp. SG-8]|uniref:5-formyltetrahydrofolate cyclo-ligase n=1 Tax=Marilutibacter penaei TaxID=2759900 RepID=A0A7W3U3P2_9GAMM|nr:5-formyltetrahydrofolate cyclo-ligase [Lysobacter penaei]MBB1088329.1 5-formyltetrahydrofolate cyclo-ligase [Lysobacter penaei]
MTDDPMAQRRQLRDRLRQARRAVTPASRNHAADGLARQLTSLAFAPSSGPVAGYWASDGEVSLEPWRARLPGSCTYCLPVLGDDGQLRFAPYGDGTPLRPNRFGIPEPDLPVSRWLRPIDMALVVLPLVGFDLEGERLGMGGGWYDRSFAFRHGRPGSPWMVGAAFDLQAVPRLPAQAWDVPLDAVCTESITLDFRPSHRSPE